MVDHRRGRCRSGLGRVVEMNAVHVDDIEDVVCRSGLNQEHEVVGAGFAAWLGLKHEGGLGRTTVGAGM